jgi:hypothetical protein
MLWFPVGIRKDLFEDSNKGEGGVRYLPISLYHTHIIAYTCARCLFCRPRWRMQLRYNRWTYLSHCVRTKMISRDLTLQRVKYSCWHFQVQWTMNLIIDNESNSDLWKETKRQRERENRHWYQDFSWTLVHALTFSNNHTNNHTNSHTQTHKTNVCVCVFARARVCLCYCVESEQPPSASIYGQGTLTRHPRADSGSIKASGCAALWAHQRLQAAPRAA